MSTGAVGDVPGGSIPSRREGMAPGDSEGTGGQDSTRGQILLDPEWAQQSLNLQDAGKYLKVYWPTCPIARKGGYILLHRLVKWYEIKEGPHDCKWCGWGGLDWFAEEKDKDHYLVVDHLNGDLDYRRTSLAATHKWCNDNRAMVESLKIGWEPFLDTPPSKRPALRNTGTGRATNTAMDLRNGTVTRKPKPAPAKVSAAATDGKPTPWDGLFTVPAALLEKYAFLAEVKP